METLQRVPCQHGVNLTFKHITEIHAPPDCQQEEREREREREDSVAMAVTSCPAIPVI